MLHGIEGTRMCQGTWCLEQYFNAFTSSSHMSRVGIAVWCKSFQGISSPHWRDWKQADKACAYIYIYIYTYYTLTMDCWVHVCQQKSAKDRKSTIHILPQFWGVKLLRLQDFQKLCSSRVFVRPGRAHFLHILPWASKRAGIAVETFWHIESIFI